METIDIIVELDGSRDIGEIISEFQIQGATVTRDEDPDVLHVASCPIGLVDNVEGIAQYVLESDQADEQESKSPEGCSFTDNW